MMKKLKSYPLSQKKSIKKLTENEKDVIKALIK